MAVQPMIPKQAMVLEARYSYMAACNVSTATPSRSTALGHVPKEIKSRSMGDSPPMIGRDRASHTRYEPGWGCQATI